MVLRIDGNIVKLLIDRIRSVECAMDLRISSISVIVRVAGSEDNTFLLVLH